MSPETTTTAVAEVRKSEGAEQFELMVRQAKTFACSPLVPKGLREPDEKTAVANCYIALKMAEAMGENALVVMQNIYIVHGRAGWSAQYMIGRANASGVFKGRIIPTYTGEGQKRSCTAKATLAQTGDQVQFTVSMDMAKAEGWTKNAKYQTLPDLMLFYRAATLLIRTVCPEVMLGIATREEIDDVAAAIAPPAKRLTMADVVGDDEGEKSGQWNESDVDASGEVVVPGGALFDEPKDGKPLRNAASM